MTTLIDTCPHCGETKLQPSKITTTLTQFVNIPDTTHGRWVPTEYEWAFVCFCHTKENKYTSQTFKTRQEARNAAAAQKPKSKLRTIFAVDVQDIPEELYDSCREIIDNFPWHYKETGIISIWTQDYPDNPFIEWLKNEGWITDVDGEGIIAVWGT